MKNKPQFKSVPHTIVVTAIIALAMIGPARADTFLSITNGYSAPLGYGGLRDGWVNGYPTGTSVYAGTLGFSFYVVSTDILVTSLGYYDGPNSAAANVPGYTASSMPMQSGFGTARAHSSPRPSSPPVERRRLPISNSFPSPPSPSLPAAPTRSAVWSRMQTPMARAMSSSTRKTISPSVPGRM